MKTFVTFLTLLVTGYVVGALLGYLAIQSMSGNTHDRAVEAAVTGAFVAGPLTAVIVLITWAIYRSTRRGL